MLLTRLFGSLLALALIAGLSVPALGQDKDKDKNKDKDKDKDKKDGAVTLKWKFEAQRPFYQVMTTETKQVMEVMKNPVNQTQKQTFYFRWRPLKLDADSVAIEQEIIGVKMEIDIGGTKISYDSTGPVQANNPLGDFFKALVGSKFTVALDTRTYQVREVAGREEFIKKLVAANPGMRQLLDTILSTDAMKEMAEPTFAVVPGKAVTPGETWSKKSTLDMGPIGKYVNQYTYTYEKVTEKALHQIAVKTTLDYTPPDEKAGQGGLPFKIKAAKLTSSNPVGQVFFDNTRGRVQSSSMKLTLKGDLTIEIGGQQTTVSLSQDQTSTTETFEEDPLPKKK